MKSNANQMIQRVLGVAVLLLGAATLGNAQTSKHVNHADAMNAAVQKVNPEYSAMAKQLKLTGSVEVNVLISEDGRVEKVEPVSGNPVLFRCAEDALKRWKFTPFTEDGKAVKAVAAMNFSFKL